jgi:hypothetical protein
MNRHFTRLTVLPALTGLAFLLFGASLPATAQGSAPRAQQAPQDTQILTANQLTDLVAPIALYPDPLLTQVLVASTYPLEVVEAQQWLQRNHTLTGTQLMDAARQQNWDPSVQALVAFPDVLNWLNSDIRWTRDLGNAFLAQQADVMSAVQRLRASATANGRLVSTPQQTVTTQTQDGQSEIAIQPANPEVIYVPVYAPAYIWGPPAWGFYPPLYYPAFGFGFWPGVNIGLFFGGWGWGGWGWGWGPNWFGNTVFINHAFFHRFGFHDHDFRGGGSAQGIWSHDPSHRLGVTYPNHQLAGRYQAASAASRANMAGFAGRNSFNQGARPGALPNGNHYPISGNVRGPQGFRGSSPQGAPGGTQFGNRSGIPGGSRAPQSFRGALPSQGGAARSFLPPQGRSFAQPMPSFGHGFGSAARSFGGGFGGGRSFGGGGFGGHVGGGRR